MFPRGPRRTNSPLPLKFLLCSSALLFPPASDSSPTAPHVGGVGGHGGVQRHARVVGAREEMAAPSSSAGFGGMSTDNAKGLALAVSSSAFIGASFIVKKMGLRRAADSGVRAGELRHSVAEAPLLPCLLPLASGSRRCGSVGRRGGRLGRLIWSSG